MSGDLVMPWGKFKGRPINEVPSAYLWWLACECDDERIAEAAGQEIRWRDDHNAHTEELT